MANHTYGQNLLDDMTWNDHTKTHSPETIRITHWVRDDDHTVTIYEYRHHEPTLEHGGIIAVAEYKTPIDDCKRSFTGWIIPPMKQTHLAVATDDEDVAVNTTLKYMDDLTERGFDGPYYA